MASANFLPFIDNLARGNIDFDANAFRMLLVTSVPTETQLDTWNDRADVTIEHAASGGYTQGGLVVTPTVGAMDTSNNRVPVTFALPAAPQYSGSTISAVGGIIYKFTGAAANDLLVCFVDFNGTVTSANGTFSITLSSPMYINR